jgi:hypothetical protein
MFVSPGRTERPATEVWAERNLFRAVFAPGNQNTRSKLADRKN